MSTEYLIEYSQCDTLWLRSHNREYWKAHTDMSKCNTPYPRPYYTYLWGKWRLVMCHRNRNKPINMFSLPNRKKAETEKSNTGQS